MQIPVTIEDASVYPIIKGAFVRAKILEHHHPIQK
jgi:hypothetical protein